MIARSFSERFAQCSTKAREARPLLAQRQASKLVLLRRAGYWGRNAASY
jgi:hypothetical protein